MGQTRHNFAQLINCWNFINNCGERQLLPHFLILIQVNKNESYLNFKSFYCSNGLLNKSTTWNFPNRFQYKYVLMKWFWTFTDYQIDFWINFYTFWLPNLLIEVYSNVLLVKFNIIMVISVVIIIIIFTIIIIMYNARQN